MDDHFVKQIISVEHDPNWYKCVSEKVDHNKSYLILQNQNAVVSENNRRIADCYFKTKPKFKFDYNSAKLTRRGLNDREFVSYASTINNYKEKFDCIIIDGMARRLCCYYAVGKLKSDGFIVFDNSNRSDYIEGYKYLNKCGFYCIPFWGNVPGAAFPSCTSLFIRNEKILAMLTYEKSYFSLPEY